MLFPVSLRNAVGLSSGILSINRLGRRVSIHFPGSPVGPQFDRLLSGNFVSLDDPRYPCPTTKSTKRTRKEAEEELNLSLKRLKTDYVDLWQIHSVNEKEEVQEIFAPRGAIEAFEAAKKAGKCRFIGFTGHHDPTIHLEMLKAYDKYDTILMPLHIADPAYLSFEKQVLPLAVERGMGIQRMKNFANAKLLQSFSAPECLGYVLSLPIHCTAIGCTTIGQLEDDVRIAQ